MLREVELDPSPVFGVDYELVVHYEATLLDVVAQPWWSGLSKVQMRSLTVVGKLTMSYFRLMVEHHLEEVRHLVSSRA